MHDLKANVFLRYAYIDRIDESLISNNLDVLRLAPHTNGQDVDMIVGPAWE